VRFQTGGYADRSEAPFSHLAGSTDLGKRFSRPPPLNFTVLLQINSKNRVTSKKNNRELEFPFVTWIQLGNGRFASIGELHRREKREGRRRTDCARRTGS
jgi:hypothetical protein